jgi:hypothetical protein
VRDIAFVFSVGLPISRRMVSNLCRLSITCRDTSLTFEDLTGLFDLEVLCSLSHLALVGRVSSASVVQQLLSILSVQCSYSFDVYWYDTPNLTRTEASQLLVKTFRQLRSRKPIELTLKLHSDMYKIQLRTLPRRELHINIDRAAESKLISA